MHARSAKAVQVQIFIHSQAQSVFIIKNYFALKPFAEAFINTYPNKQVPIKTTVHRLLTKFWGTGSMCLWEVIIEWYKSWNYRCTNFKQEISCMNSLLPYVFFSFILCKKVFVCSSWDCVLNGTPCTVVQSLEMKNLCIYTVERFLSWILGLVRPKPGSTI